MQIRRSPSIRGFTLVEIMIAVVIIGLIAAMAIPAYKKVQKRSKEAEGYSLADGIRREVLEFYEYTGRFPANNAELGLPPPHQIKGDIVESVEVDAGVISVTFEGGEGIDPLILRPYINPDYPTGPIRWLRK